MITDLFLTVATILAALALDRYFGEPRRFHPLVGFGALAQKVERFCNTGGAIVQYIAGIGSWGVVVLPIVITVYLADRALSFNLWLACFFDALILYLAIGWRSMCEHIEPIYRALANGDIDSARQRLSYVVSRDTAALNHDDIVAATIETTLENSSDSLFASLFWFVFLGPAGVILHRLSNTLDAMWGYRNARFNFFGAFAARVDDALNILPSQLVGFSFFIVSRSSAALRCHVRQGWRWKSISAGAVMASGAAALGVELGGTASYHGVANTRPPLGEGRAPNREDIARAITLVNHTLLLWLGAGITLYALLLASQVVGGLE
ncbi:MAG: adenosylcobinamide-phosphate synthase CbiB [Spongiibacter sp.]